jgi:type II secretory pathway component PulF
MADVSLEQVLALNEELAALDAAGIPIELGDPSLSTTETLAKINSSLALRASLGQPIDAALAEDTQLPAVYRYAVLTGLESNQPLLVLDGVSRRPAAWNELRLSLGRAFLQPLILLALAYCGFIFLCLWFSPSLERVYEQVQQRPNVGVRILVHCREWMSVWVPLVPLLLAVGIYAWNSRGRSVRSRLISSQHYFQTVRNAMFAEQVGSLVAAGVPLAESVRTASNASGDSELVAASEVVATHERGEPLQVADAQKLDAFPPLLRWALTQELGDEPLPEMLRFIGETYRQSVERQAGMWQVALPTFVGAFVGGLIILLFCLSMFGPYIGLLRDLAS